MGGIILKPLKVCVYAICKNEEKFINRWVDSMSEADYIVVLDTGSTDNSLSKLRARGIDVHQKVISPWRFDVARNIALNFVPNLMLSSFKIIFSQLPLYLTLPYPLSLLNLPSPYIK